MIECAPTEVGNAILMDLLSYVQTDTDSNDVILLAEVLDATKLKIEDQPQESPNMVKMLCKIFVKTSHEVSFSDVIERLSCCVQSVCALEDCTDRAKIKLLLACYGLINDVTGGIVVKTCEVETFESRLQRFEALFKHMNCKSQSDFEEVYFFFKSLQLDDTWTQTTSRQVADQRVLSSLTRNCENLKKSLPCDPIQELFSSWKEQLAEVALVCTSDGPVCSSDRGELAITFPDVNYTLVQLRKVDFPADQNENSSLSNTLREISTIRQGLEARLLSAYQSSACRLKYRTACALVDMKSYNITGEEWVSSEG